MRVFQLEFYKMSGLVAVIGILLFCCQVHCQDCDSFICLRAFHDEFISGENNATAACRAAEKYNTCIQGATDACTNLDLIQQQEVSNRVKNYALCSHLSIACPDYIKIGLMSSLLLSAFVL